MSFIGLGSRLVALGILWLVSAFSLAGNAQVESSCPDPSEPLSVESLLEAADCHSVTGNLIAEISLLERLREYSNGPQATLVSYRLGAAYLQHGDLFSAEEALLAASTEAEEASNWKLLADSLNDLGRTFMALDRPFEAVATFNDAYRIADETPTRLAAGINLARALIEIDYRGDMDRILLDLHSSAKGLPQSREKARKSLSLAHLYMSSKPPNWRAKAIDLSNAALILSRQVHDVDSELYTLGFLSELHLAKGDQSLALDYARQAALLAQRSDAETSLYRWFWKTASVLRSMDRRQEALDAYRLAAQSLDSVRLDVSARSYDSFARDIAPLYFEFADLLLSESRDLDPEEAGQVLREARWALEQLKIAEVEDYLDDDCAVRQDEAFIDEISSDAAILYPMVFDDRIELLLSVRGRIHQSTTYVNERSLSATADRFRELLERPEAGSAHLPYGQQLYDWVIQPLEEQLRESGAKTLVVVPGGILRTIPFAALHDGQSFLLERYALATSPGLTLTSSHRPARDVEKAQVNGLSQAVQGFAALEHVNREIDNISERFNSDVNRDADFSVQNLESELASNSYDFVHIATHGQVHRDRRRSFLLAYDGPITMERLVQILGTKKYRGQPVDLLFLSACQTAVGDERAALGLAGIAVNSGAASVVASLWLINDESTAELVSRFYERLSMHQDSKADLLQHAQLALLHSDDFSHPYYWAPFLLVGNWL